MSAWPPVVTARREVRTKAGKRMGIFMLSDMTGQYEATAFAEALGQYDEFLQQDARIVVEIEGEDRPEGARITILRAEGLAAAAAKVKRTFALELDGDAALEDIARRFGHGGECAIDHILCKVGTRRVRIRLPKADAVVSAETISVLKQTRGVALVRELN